MGSTLLTQQQPAYPCLRLCLPKRHRMYHCKTAGDLCKHCCLCCVHCGRQKRGRAHGAALQWRRAILHAWHSYGRRCSALLQTEAACVAMRTARILHAWQHVVTGKRDKRARAQYAERHRCMVLMRACMRQMRYSVVASSEAGRILVLRLGKRRLLACMKVCNMIYAAYQSFATASWMFLHKHVHAMQQSATRGIVLCTCCM